MLELCSDITKKAENAKYLLKSFCTWGSTLDPIRGICSR